jgi:hypothetical protein
MASTPTTPDHQVCEEEQLVTTLRMRDADPESTDWRDRA